MRSLGALRALLICAALAVPAVVFPAGAQAGTASCGNFRPIDPANPPGTVRLNPGDGLTYILDTLGLDATLTLETATVDWGDGDSDSLSRPLPPGDEVELPEPPRRPKRYNTPGTYQLYLRGVTGRYPDGTTCRDDLIHLGTVVVSAPAESPCPCPPPSITTSKRKCRDFLRRKGSGRLGRIYRRGTNKRTRCGRGRADGSRRCTVTVVYRPCGCRYIATLHVPARGKVKVVRVKKKPLRGGGRRRGGKPGLFATGSVRLVEGTPSLALVKYIR